MSDQQPEPAPSRRRGSRPALTQEEQTQELRVKARRRLIGALALVLVAVVVLPILLEPAEPPATEAPLVIPAPPVLAPQPDLARTDAGTVTPIEPLPAPADPVEAPPVAPVPPPPATVPAAPAAPPPTPPSAPPAAAAPTPPPAPARAPVAASRTDDGAMALAMLEGRVPVPAAGGNASAAPSSGRFVVQIAAYSTEKDALSRRDSLRQSGLSNAYVERAQADGKTTFRLRVGPFQTRDAAQAAQARLRALGYQNGFIAGQ